MKLLGVDVGFSAKRATTGIAWLDGDRLGVATARTYKDDRRRKLPPDFHPSHIALDGPLPPLSHGDARRLCEHALIHAPFHNRCKPGLSDFGSGLRLRRESWAAFEEFGGDLAASITREGLVAEAFPNAFLGVMTPAEAYPRAPKGRRGKRFDWLYDEVAATGRLARELSDLLDLPVEVCIRLRRERNHEKRAALICLITAALAAQRIATTVGDEAGGWFWLPPRSLWQPWAVAGLDQVLMRVQGVSVAWGG